MRQRQVEVQCPRCRIWLTEGEMDKMRNCRTAKPPDAQIPARRKPVQAEARHFPLPFIACLLARLLASSAGERQQLPNGQRESEVSLVKECVRMLVRCRSTARSFHFGARRCSSAADACLRTQILDKAVELVHLHGWTEECISHAAQQLSLPPLAHQIISNGATDLVCHFLDKKAKHVRQVMAAGDVASDSHESEQEQKLLTAIETHLQYLLPYQKSWPDALAVCVEPQSVCTTLPLALQTADDLCYFSHSTASHLDWYTERGLMMFLYGTTELFFLTDSSNDLADTR